MADCACLVQCSFFNDRLADKQGSASLDKARYCLGDSRHCARYKVFEALGSAEVPEDLYPNDRELAQQLLVAVGR